MKFIKQFVSNNRDIAYILWGRNCNFNFGVENLYAQLWLQGMLDFIVTDMGAVLQV
jgi:hypothetical protein